MASQEAVSTQVADRPTVKVGERLGRTDCHWLWIPAQHRPLAVVLSLVSPMASSNGAALAPMMDP